MSPGKECPRGGRSSHHALQLEYVTERGGGMRPHDEGYLQRLENFSSIVLKAFI